MSNGRTNGETKDNMARRPVVSPNIHQNCICKREARDKCYSRLAKELGVKCVDLGDRVCKVLAERDIVPREAEPKPYCDYKRRECPKFKPLRCRCKYEQDIKYWLRCGGPKPEFKVS